MDLVLISFTLLLAVVITFAVSFFSTNRLHKKVAENGGSLPPGTFGWPIIGETFEFVAALQRGTIETFIIERTKKYSSPVFKTSLLGRNFVIFSGPAANKFLFTNEYELFTRWRPRSVQKLFPSMSFVPIEHDAKKGRKFMGVVLKLDASQDFVARIDMISRNHLKNYWEGKDEIKVYPLVKKYTFALACNVFLSIDDPDHAAKLLHIFHSLCKGLNSIHLNVPGTSFHRAVGASAELRHELGLIIKKRREDLAKNLASPTQDVLSGMLTIPYDDGEFMSDMEVSDKILAFLVAAHETTTATITFTMKYLVGMPHLYQEIIGEQKEITKSMKPREVLCWDDLQNMKHTWKFVSETMRIIPPVQGAYREVKTDFTYNGLFIPKGWKVYWSLGMTHRNPEYFSEPEVFDPTRFERNPTMPYTYIPFGVGPLMCPGKSYARVAILVFLHYVIKMYKWEIMLPNEEIKIEASPAPSQGFPIRLFPNND